MKITLLLCTRIIFGLFTKIFNIIKNIHSYRLFWGIAYLATIPLFAMYYTYVIPKDFHHTNLPLEPSVISITNDMEQQIKSQVISGILARHSASKYILNILNDPEVEISELEHKALQMEAFDYSFFGLFKDPFAITESVHYQDTVFSSYILNGIHFHTVRTDFSLKDEPIFIFGENLNNIDVTKVSMSNGEITFLLSLPDSFFTLSNQIEETREMRDEQGKLLIEDFPLKQTFDYLYGKDLFSANSPLTNLYRRNGSTYSCRIPDSIKEYGTNITYRNLNIRCRLNSDVNATESRVFIESFWTISLGEHQYPFGEGPDNVAKVLPIVTDGILTGNRDKLASILDGKAHLLDDHFFRMLYLSAVTVTTLGYGDITPITVHARIAITIQSVFGIIMIGLFLAAITKK